ncbi:MAG: TonB-dependent siderophore receptor [Leptolyngbyaceae cyanobacterium CSU_1_3]|nr:TonB-dependent siderophore receptor [Leptolyngbyaceae cyanobacterium CSU_1_3]
MPQLSELEPPATTIEEWVAQIETSLVQIANVRVETTETGLQVILETAEGETLAPETRTIGNALIADIPNAAIAEEFSQAEPIAGIALVSVTQLPGDRVRVAITGTDAPPAAEVRSDGQGLIVAVSLGEAGTAADEEAIQVVVTGEQDEGYNPSSATTATRTDTPLRDIPQSIQVIPQQVLEDQNVTRLQDAVRNNAPGVTSRFGLNQAFVIRGFEQNFNLRNGFRTSSGFAPLDVDLANVEQIEVLRGPASVLFGQLQPGGVINIVTEQPLNEPYYNLQFTGGQFSFYRPELDFSDSLTDDGNLRYRLNAAYQNYGSFRDFVSEERFFIAPVLQLDISENTTLTVDFSYTYSDSVIDFGVIALSDGSLVLPIDRALFYPSLDTFTEEQYQASYLFVHNFSDNWQLRNGFSFSQRREDGANTFKLGLTDDRFLSIGYIDTDFLLEDYQLQTDLIGEFNTGTIQHQLLIGFDLARSTNVIVGRDGVDPLPPIDIFDPDYDVSAPETQPGFFSTTFTDSLGIYIQDQIDITDSLHLLIGGRFDLTEQYGNTLRTFSSQEDTAFSPRVGVVYQPVEPISLYASYSRSFNPVIGRSQTDETFNPERGTQYEIGIRADITDTLSATLAAFEVTKANVLTTDPANPNFSIQVGEQRSRGVEFIVQGEILPGWNLVAGYAYTDARVTEDNNIPEGDFLVSVPENAANLWTTYEIQNGDLQGLGFGFGLVFVDERQGDLPNSNFQIPSYVRADAALFYRQNNWRAAININNLFGTEYYESAANRNDVYPGAPFNATASLSYTF